ncbi:hypothetical protein G7Y89_g11332 [Cudoniella acicularis]|uniref:Uncharacterized protein n=1 Tax=Cudoniella acicularis TaxID=354080 RepID=A0A8H4RB18_9HELO|nr:hypothetical protein G7Y89_g11332 [Cudoniella acicularis]
MDHSTIHSTADVPPQFLKSAFLVGHVPLKALASDPRVSYSLYIPPEHYNPNPASPSQTTPLLPLLVVIHGNDRNIWKSLDRLVSFSHTHHCAILAPLFPAGLDGPEDLDSFKLLSSRTLRSDLAVLSMLEEIRLRYLGIITEKVFLMGFSGGGQLVHRFLYLYPERLYAVSIGAPGRVTGLDDSLPWPRGTKDTQEKFGVIVEPDKIRAVKAILLVVGSDDNVVHGGEEFWAWLGERRKKTPENAVSGTLTTPTMGRLDTLMKLQEAWRLKGIETKLEIVPGVAHKSEGVLSVVLDFFGPLLLEKNPNTEL